MVRISVAILPCAAVLLSAVTSSSARQMSKRAVSTIFTSCPLDQSSYAGRTIAQYSAYLIKGVYLPSGTLFNGPLGLKGTYQNSEVTFGAARYTNCNATETSFITVNENGLVISGEDGNKDVYVTGSELVSTNGEVDLSNGCSSLYLTNSYDLQFNIITDSMITASLRLASLTPNMYMDATGNIVDKGSEDDTYKVFTFNTCNNGACNIAGDLSDPAGIFGGENNYEGPTGDVPSPDATVVFNIPVDQKGSFNINNPAVSNGFYACRTIYNFYPVTTSGDYRPKGSFYLLRNTANLEGITLAPLGLIRDGGEGSFIGKLVGYDYALQDGVEDNNVKPFEEAGDGCSNYEGCFAVAPGVPTVTETVTNNDGATVTEYVGSSQTVYVVPYYENDKGHKKNDWNHGKDWKDDEGWKGSDWEKESW